MKHFMRWALLVFAGFVFAYNSVPEGQIYNETVTKPYMFWRSDSTLYTWEHLGRFWGYPERRGDTTGIGTRFAIADSSDSSFYMTIAEAGPYEIWHYDSNAVTLMDVHEWMQGPHLMPGEIRPDSYFVAGSLAVDTMLQVGDGTSGDQTMLTFDKAYVVRGFDGQFSEVLPAIYYKHFSGVHSRFYFRGGDFGVTSISEDGGTVDSFTLYVDAYVGGTTGEVGINTSVPDQELDVIGTAQADTVGANYFTDKDSLEVVFLNNVGIFTDEPDEELDVTGTAQADSLEVDYVTSKGGVDVVFLDDVGIFNAAPAEELDVTGTAQADSVSTDYIDSKGGVDIVFLDDVGIFNSAPAQELEVTGCIQTDSLKTDWIAGNDSTNIRQMHAWEPDTSICGWSNVTGNQGDGGADADGWTVWKSGAKDGDLYDIYWEDEYPKGGTGIPVGPWGVCNTNGVISFANSKTTWTSGDSTFFYTPMRPPISNDAR